MRGRGPAAAVCAAALAVAAWSGWQLAYELHGGGTPGTLRVERCDRRLTYDNHYRHAHRRGVYECTGRFTGDDGSVAGDARVRTGHEAAGDALPVVRAHGNLYDAPEERNAARYVAGLGAAALLLAAGLFGLLTGYALRRGDDLRTAVRALPARRLLGPVLAAAAVAGAVTAVVAGLVR